MVLLYLLQLHGLYSGARRMIIAVLWLVHGTSGAFRVRAHNALAVLRALHRLDGGLGCIAAMRRTAEVSQISFLVCPYGAL